MGLRHAEKHTNRTRSRLFRTTGKRQLLWDVHTGRGNYLSVWIRFSRLATIFLWNEFGLRSLFRTVNGQMVGRRVTNNLKCFQSSGHVLIWGNRAKYAKENNTKPVSILLVPAGIGSGCLPNRSPNLTASAKSISVYLLAPTFHTYGNAKPTSITLTDLYECNVQAVHVASAIGLYEAEIKIPKFFTSI
jgi:hypothetical protein